MPRHVLTLTLNLPHSHQCSRTHTDLPAIVACFSDASMVMLAVLSRNNKILGYSIPITSLTTGVKFDEFAQEQQCKHFCVIIVLSSELPC